MNTHWLRKYLKSDKSKKVILTYHRGNKNSCHTLLNETMSSESFRLSNIILNKHVVSANTRISPAYAFISEHASQLSFSHAVKQIFFCPYYETLFS